jgi:hypothetical protein
LYEPVLVAVGNCFQAQLTKKAAIINMNAIIQKWKNMPSEACSRKLTAFLATCFPPVFLLGTLPLAGVKILRLWSLY